MTVALWLVPVTTGSIDCQGTWSERLSYSVNADDGTGDTKRPVRASTIIHCRAKKCPFPRFILSISRKDVDIVRAEHGKPPFPWLDTLIPGIRARCSRSEGHRAIKLVRDGVPAAGDPPDRATDDIQPGTVGDPFRWDKRYTTSGYSESYP